MSRIGREPIAVPAGVTITIDEGNAVTVKGPKGTLTQKFSSLLTIENKAGTLTVTRPSDDRVVRSLHGTTRALLSDMVIGVTDGFTKKLEINGVGYRAQKSGKTLTLNLGHSHPVTFEETDAVTFDVPDSNTVIVKGADKQAVGQVAAEIRAKRPPEPYLGKGVKYDYERIRRKAGKTGK